MTYLTLTNAANATVASAQRPVSPPVAHRSERGDDNAKQNPR